MTSPLEEFYFGLPEPDKSAYLYLRSYLLKDPDMTESWKWKLPFFDYKGKYFCYLWKDKHSALPYIGFAHGVAIGHKALTQGVRKQIAVLHFDPTTDLPIETLDEVLLLGKAMRN